MGIEYRIDVKEPLSNPGRLRSIFEESELGVEEIVYDCPPSQVSFRVTFTRNTGWEEIRNILDTAGLPARQRVANPPEGAHGSFPTTPDEAVLEGIPQIAPELIARIERSRAAVAALSPPEEYAADHATIVEYFDELLANQEAILAAAESGDIGAVRTGIDTTRDLYCEVELSDEVLPAATYFGAPDDPPPFCTL